MVAIKPHPKPHALAAIDETERTGQAAQVAHRTRRARLRAETPETLEEMLDLAPVDDDEHRPELLETQLVPALAPVPHTPARRAMPTHRLVAADRQAHAHADLDMQGTANSTLHAASSVYSLPEPDFIVHAAAVQAGLAAAAALAGAGFLLANVGYTLWPFSLAGILGAGGWLGYAVSGRSRRLAAMLLLFAQLGALAWLLALIGARAALLALVPALALLALSWLGRGAAYAAAIFALALYALAALLQLTGAFSAPVALSNGGYALLDVGFVAVGLLGMLMLASRMHSGRLRAEMAARARRHEVRTLRVRLTHQRQQVEDDAARLDDALARALAGKGTTQPVETDGLLNPLAETANTAAERLATLQRDREDRLRLEGAVHMVTRAVERAWLGLPWSWPEWSGTVLDELVALLRTPRPQETHASWSDETPTLTAIPTVERAAERGMTGMTGMTPRPWERPTPVSAPMSAVRPLRAVPPLSPVSPPALNGNGHPSDPHLASLATGTDAPSALLPWRDWDTWREWALTHDE